MMKRVYFPIFLIVMLSLCLAVGCGNGQDQQANYTTPENTHFRNTRWGMTRDHVMAVEEATKVPGDEAVLRYQCKLLDTHDCELFYLFDDENLLVAAGYVLDADKCDFCDDTTLEGEDKVLANRMMAVDFYREYQATLSERFGDPVADDVNWYSEALSAACEYDVRIGYARNALYLTTRWNTPESIISEELTKGTFKVAYMKRQ